jgi:hypothetical protein
VRPENAGGARDGGLFRDAASGRPQTGDAGDLAGPQRSPRLLSPEPGERGAAPKSDAAIGDGGRDLRRDATRYGTSPPENPSNSASHSLRRSNASLPGSPGSSDASMPGPAASLPGHGPVGAPERGASAHGIDLTTPDGGYANLRRRAERRSLIGHAEKKTLAVAPANSGPHPPGMPPRADAGTSRNAIGVLLSRGAGAEPSLGAHGPGIAGYTPLAPKGEGTTAAGGGSELRAPALGGNGASGIGDVRRPPVHPGIPANPSPYATGINGTSMGQIAARSGMIGGPAKDRSAINGTGIRPKF